MKHGGRDELVTDGPLEHVADAVDLLVDVRPRPAAVYHVPPHGLQGTRAELHRGRLAEQFLQRPKRQLVLLEFLVPPVGKGAVVALSVYPEAG